MAKIVCMVDTDAGTMEVTLDGNSLDNVNCAKFHKDDEIDVETGKPKICVHIETSESMTEAQIYSGAKAHVNDVFVAPHLYRSEFLGNEFEREVAKMIRS